MGLQDSKQLLNVKYLFSNSADDWYKLYQAPRWANDIVLINRMNHAIDFISQNLVPGSRVLDAGRGAGLPALKLA